MMFVGLLAIVVIAGNIVWRMMGFGDTPWRAARNTLSVTGQGIKAAYTSAFPKSEDADGKAESAVDTAPSATPKTAEPNANPVIIEASASSDFVAYDVERDVIVVYLYTWKGGHKYLGGGWVRVVEKSSGRWAVMFVRAGVPVEFPALRGQEYSFQAVDYDKPSDKVTATRGTAVEAQYAGAPAGYARKVELESERKL
jgi:hypothetical protein